MNFKTIFTAALLCSMNSFASIDCLLVEEQLSDESQTLVLVPQNEFSISLEGSSLTLNKVQEVHYPMYIANKTFPEIGVLTAFKGRQGRRASADQSLVSMRFNSTQTYPVLGSEKMLIKGTVLIMGKDKTNKSPETSTRLGADIACDPSILAEF